MGKKAKSSAESTTSSKKKRINGCKKGKQFEREIANRLGHIFPEVKRKLEYQTADLAEEAGVDLEDCDRIKIQCKCKQNYVSINTINEIRTKNPSDIPVLVTKGNRQEAMAVLPFDKLVTLLEIAYGLELPFRTFDVAETLINMEPRYITASQVEAVKAIPYDDPDRIQKATAIYAGLDSLI